MLQLATFGGRDGDSVNVAVHWHKEKTISWTNPQESAGICPFSPASSRTPHVTEAGKCQESVCEHDVRMPL
jgi:hypothetical protein